MKKTNEPENVNSCYVGKEKFCFTIPDLSTKNDGKSYSGHANVWREGERANTFVIPVYVGGEDIDLIHEKIILGISKCI